MWVYDVSYLLNMWVTLWCEFVMVHWIILFEPSLCICYVYNPGGLCNKGGGSVMWGTLWHYSYVWIQYLVPWVCNASSCCEDKSIYDRILHSGTSCLHFHPMTSDQYFPFSWVFAHFQACLGNINIKHINTYRGLT